MEEIRIYDRAKKIIREKDIITIKAKSKQDFLKQVKEIKIKNWALWGCFIHHRWFRD